MTEELLHYVWKFKLFDHLNLKTTSGESIEIIKSGEHNFDAGPDFFNARIKLGKTLWAGNIEVHVRSSDWQKHSHQKDSSYNNIVLHVVYNADIPLYRTSGETIPTLELKDRMDVRVQERYLDFKKSSGWIPCEKQLSIVPSITINSTLDRLVTERLERKAESIISTLKLNHNNWEETFYQYLARNFGFKTNAEPFELVAKSLPSIILAKSKTSLLQMEALLFGQAGLLDEYFKDKYPQHLQNEYTFLKRKFKLKPIEAHLWKFLRLRPVNFPTIRISQFANLIYQSTHLFSRILEAEQFGDLKKMMNVDVSEYWQTHYVFDKHTKLKSKHLGEEALNNMIINTVVPFLFVYGKQKKEERYVERALKFLEEIPGESNAIISKWESLKLPVAKAHTTQALLQLKSGYCDLKKCLSCSIGNYLLKNP